MLRIFIINKFPINYNISYKLHVILRENYYNIILRRRENILKNGIMCVYMHIKLYFLNNFGQNHHFKNTFQNHYVQLRFMIVDLDG